MSNKYCLDTTILWNVFEDEVSFSRKPQVKQLPLFSAQAAPERKLLPSTEKGKEKSTSWSTCSMQCQALQFGRACCLYSPQELSSLRSSGSSWLGGLGDSQEQLWGFRSVHRPCRGRDRGWSQGAPGDSHSSLWNHCWSHLSILLQITHPSNGSNELCSPLKRAFNPSKGVLPFGTCRCHNPALTCSLPCSYTNYVSQPIKQWVITQL